ncbi:EAL domain-containing protein [Marinomonas algicola]|uniref:EAL domain-containing protein n=1 Tax=Marinomonas algicola TaxID=2773454 RepID=UPI00174B7F00|nr:EAL domain-containing protein [Marinomonas algicola]
MYQSSRILLTSCINISLLIIFASAVFFLGNAWQQHKVYVVSEKEKELYFSQVEGYLEGVTSFLSSVAANYTGECPRDFVRLMRKELFNTPGAIEFGVIQKEGDHGAVACNSWGDIDRIHVREPSPHKGFLMTGPHTINSLEMPIFVIKKTVNDFEYNVIIKKSSVDIFSNAQSGLIISNSEEIQDHLYRYSEVISNLAYIESPSSLKKVYNLYFIPITLLLSIIAYFLVTPKLVKAIEKIILRRRIEQHYYHNEYQPIIDTKTGQVFSIEVLLRSKDDTATIDTITKMKHLDLSIEHTLFQIVQVESSFREDFIKKNSFQINISSCHLESLYFVERLQQLNHPICHNLILEVTEDENLMIKKQTIKKHMEILKRQGCRFAIDDFGMEYAGLGYVSEFDFDIVKTDKIFMDHTHKNTAILKSIIAFCNELGIHCIAEGIETEEDKKKTIEIGIHLQQGWYHARPMSTENIVLYK